MTSSMVSITTVLEASGAFVVLDRGDWKGLRARLVKGRAVKGLLVTGACWLVKLFVLTIACKHIFFNFSKNIQLGLWRFKYI